MAHPGGKLIKVFIKFGKSEGIELLIFYRRHLHYDTSFLGRWELGLSRFLSRKVRRFFNNYLFSASNWKRVLCLIIYSLIPLHLLALFFEDIQTEAFLIFNPLFHWGNLLDTFAIHSLHFNSLYSLRHKYIFCWLS